MNDAAIKAMIKRHEGYEGEIYKDIFSNLTVGFGHLLAEGQTIDRSICDAWFQEDYGQAKRNWNSLLSEYDIQHIGAVRKAVIIDMLFNMGLGGVLKFRKMLKALVVKKYELAADEMVNSQWYGQVKSRAVELTQMMRTGSIVK